MRNTLWKIACFAIVAFASLQASAQWSVTAHVTLIDAGGMGARSGDSMVPIIFQIDQAITGNPCATSGSAPAILLYAPYAFSDSVSAPLDTTHPTGNDRQMVNSKAILSTLQLAIATGYNVKLLGYNGGSGYCQVYDIQIVNY